MKEALFLLGDFVHLLQKNRGSSALYLGSKLDISQQQLEDQFHCSDKAAQALQEALGRWTQKQNLSAVSLNKIKHLLECFHELQPTHTHKVIESKISATDSINLYSHQFISPCIEIMVEVALFSKNSDPAKVSTYNNFLQWKERVGMERAVGLRELLSNAFSTPNFLKSVRLLLSEQQAYEKSFLMLADQQQKALVKEILAGEEIEKLEKIHHSLNEAGNVSIAPNITPERWFELMSAKIDKLKLIEEKLIDTLLQDDASTADTPDIKTDKPPAETQNGHGKHYDFLKSLPLFTALTEKDLDKIIQCGQIRRYEKGKLLFLQGEPSNRLYVIISGWVKIFKGTSAGDETILQMLSSGNTLMESAVFLNSPYPVSAQIVSDAELLTLPAPVIREQLRQNNDLALNMLANMSRRSQVLISQIERARLKTASERVGWFLLKIYLEQGRVNNCVELPYDKSIIASYLDMKPETFSRTLKSFKQQGFEIQNDTIVLPSIASLCNFCDTDTASTCDRHGTTDCPNPDCSRQ